MALKFVVIMIVSIQLAASYVVRPHRLPTFERSFSLLNEKSVSEDERQDSKVPIGSNEYISGMLSRELNEDPPERVSGDKLLGPTMKLAGGFSIVLVGCFLAFLISNGLI